MCTIAKLNLLLRARVELPKGVKLATEEFREGWNFARSVDAIDLERKILSSGWNFIKIDKGTLKSGVGDTSQEAIAGALKLALRQMSEHFNAAEVQSIELTQYPWFFLARVSVSPYRIQRSAFLPVPEDAEPLPMAARRVRSPRDSSVLHPLFASAMPQLKQVLISSQRRDTSLL